MDLESVQYNSALLNLVASPILRRQRRPNSPRPSAILNHHRPPLAHLPNRTSKPPKPPSSRFMSSSFFTTVHAAAGLGVTLLDDCPQISTTPACLATSVALVVCRPAQPSSIVAMLREKLLRSGPPAERRSSSGASLARKRSSARRRTSAGASPSGRSRSGAGASPSGRRRSAGALPAGKRIGMERSSTDRKGEEENGGHEEEEGYHQPRCDRSTSSQFVPIRRHKAQF